MKAKCHRCGKSSKSLEWYFFVAYEKCWNKICPDCGKSRVLREVCVLVLDDKQRPSADCTKCGKMTDVTMSRKGEVGGFCVSCFLEVEGEKGCICYSKSASWYCSLCKEIHAPESICLKCLNTSKNFQTFLKVILPTSVISLVVGFFLCWLFLTRLWPLYKKKKKKTQICDKKTSKYVNSKLD